MGKCKWTNIMNKPLMERGFWLRRFYKEAHKWMCKRVYNEVMAPPEWRNKPIPAIENDLVVEPPSPPKTPIAYDEMWKPSLTTLPSMMRMLACVIWAWVSMELKSRT